MYTNMKKYSRIKTLDKSYTNNRTVVSKEEQHTDLSSNNVGMCCSSLDITSNHEKSIEELVDELADIFVESILWELEHGAEEEGSPLLPSIDQRTS